MKGFLKKLLGDERGNTLMIAAAAMPLVIGSAGLANDTIQWALWKRQLQRAADSAAIAGVYARFQNAPHDSAVTTDLTKNNHAQPSLLAGYPQVGTPADAVVGGIGYAKQVSVTLAVQKPLTFSSFFMSSAPVITVNATAAGVDDGKYCVVALKRTGTAITVGGSAIANLGCGIISNGDAAADSVKPMGNKCQLTAAPVAAVGGMPSDVCKAKDVKPYALALPDPFENLYPTDIPAGMNCKKLNQMTYTQGGKTRVGPGCFTDFNVGGDTLHLDPGVYYLKNTGISLTGHDRIEGEGVTLIFTGDTPKSFSMNGESSASLIAPTTGPYAQMLMIQSSAAEEGNDNVVNGDNNSFFDGAIYFPKGDVQFNGSSSAATRCAMVVASTVDFGGNTAIQNDVADCENARTVSGKKIRLVA